MISAGIEISKETLKHNSSHISLLYTLAHLHELQGELEEAIELQRKAIEVLRSPYAKGRHERHLKKLEALLEKQSR